MSSSISWGSSDYGTFGGGLGGLVLSNSAAVKQQLDALTVQAGDGLVSETYAGLGSGTSTALTLQPVLAHQKTWQDNISAATGQMQVAQTALTQISSIASNFYAQTTNLNGLDSSEIDSIAASARDALQQMAGLLDSTDGSTYVFAGQDSTNPPVPSPDGILTSGFFIQIQQSVSGLASNGASATAAATLAIASSNAAGTSPFSSPLSRPAAALSSQRPAISIGDGQSTVVGIVASANADVVSAGSSTTGSYTRDIMRALATLGSLSSSQVNVAGFAQIVSDTAASLQGAITALNQDAGVMGDKQSALQAHATVLADNATALQSQLSGAQDVDMAKTLSQLSLMQTRLQASYQLIGSLQSLSLVKFLPAQ